jgi:hypothetical protein
MVTVIWDTWLKPGSEEEGLRLTQQVWADMRSFDGYVSHQVFVDEDAPGHIGHVAQPCRCGQRSGEIQRLGNDSTIDAAAGPATGPVGHSHGRLTKLRDSTRLQKRQPFPIYA